jgi:hypothetical protein
MKRSATDEFFAPGFLRQDPEAKRTKINQYLNKPTQ